MRIGICKKCGGNIDWDINKEICVFHSVNDCLCECPYPSNFMDWWIWTSGIVDIESCFNAWQAGREIFMNEIEELI